MDNTASYKTTSEHMNELKAEGAKQSSKPKSNTVHRVGSITMAIALISSGIVLFISLLAPHFIELTFVLKFMPLYLVILGSEILYSYFKYSTVQLKYDLLSMFFCFVIICGTMVMAVIIQIMQWYSLHGYINW